MSIMFIIRSILFYLLCQPVLCNC